MTIDANVFVSALSPSDALYADSLAFLNRVRQGHRRIVCLTLVLPECAGAIMRPTGSSTLAQTAVNFLQALPGINFVSLSRARSLRAANISIPCRLRGADAVYVAVAQEFGTTLVTWDAEMLARGTAAIVVMTPTDWLAANPV